MRLFILAASLSLFLLAACDSTSFEAPRLDLGPTAPKEYRLDLDSGIVVTFDKGPSPEAQGKVAYVTHVPSGSQMMIGRAGQVISRHDGRGGDPERLDEILADKAIMVRIIAGANADDLPFPQHADWINFVKFEGITYIANRGLGKLGLDWLGKERYRIAFELRDFAGGGYRSRDGDAAYLDPGTAIYEVTGYSPRFRLAAVSDGTVTVFEADTSPAAQTGADLLDIRGKVRSIGINSPENGITELASIEDPGMVESLVKIVLSAPVDQGRRDHDGQRYFIAFHMEDGTEVRRACWLESGELHRGIMTDPLFRDSVSQALNEMPTPTPPPNKTSTPLCTERELTPPCGSGVEIGKPYPYTLLTHCGIRGAYFAGRKWVASPVLTAEKVHPPPGWGNPFQQGEMRLLAEDLARFVTGTGLAAEFRPLPEGDKYPWGPCA